MFKMFSKQSIQLLTVGILILTSALTIVAGYYFLRNGQCKSSEGFADAKEDSKSRKAAADAQKIVRRVYKQVKRLSKVLTNPKEWYERYEMMNMSTTDLARRYLKKSASKQEKHASSA